MNNLTNMEPGSQAATVQDPTNKEPRKKECRSAIGAKAQTILEFLRACSPYEADSIRVMSAMEWGKVTSARLKRPTCWPSTASLTTVLPRKTGQVTKP